MDQLLEFCLYLITILLLQKWDSQFSLKCFGGKGSKLCIFIVPFHLIFVMSQLIFGWGDGSSEIPNSMKLSMEKTGLGLYLS